MAAPAFENGPYNLLSLDGGGIRGVSELVVLHRIMTRIQEREGLPELPKPCDYFHLIGGTSTGGLIAIMLGRLRLSTAQALTEYDSFAQKIFRKLNRKISISSQFRENALQNAVCEVVKEYTNSDLMRDPGGTPWSGKAFVCAKPSKDQDRGPRRIRAYPSDDDWDKECRIWEAARATTAAPLYFKPISITSGGVTEDFIDAALGCNNPIAEVLDEAGEILDGSCKLGCVLSLGTGTRPKKLESSRGLGRDFQVFKLLKDYTTDSERAHAETKKRFTDFPSTYFRFSVPGAAERIGMAKYKKIGELKRMTEEYLDSTTAAADVEKVVDILCGGTTENVTVGHVRYPNKEQIIMDTRRAQAGGIASRFFTGRTAILEKMSAFFPKRDNNTGPRREFLLYGMGGAGKTQIALKFKQMMESEQRFRRVFWIDATDSVTLEECYIEIAAGLPPDPSGIKGMKHAIEWFDTTSDEYLLIMDNWPDEDFASFLPRADKGSIIYTSRHQEMKQQLPREAIAEVTEMEEKDGVTFLLRTIRESTESEALRRLSLPIVKELGCLPLAIDQAGAYIDMGHCRLDNFLGVFRKQRKRMLRDPSYQKANRQDRAVYTTFDMSYKVLQTYAKGKKGQTKAEAAQMAIKILSVVCFYHNHGIMEEMVRRAAEFRIQKSWWKEDHPLGTGRLCLEALVHVDDEGQWDPQLFRNGAILLESLSLVKRDRTRCLSMHVLVHSWARDRMTADERASFSLSARALMFDSMPTKRYANHDDTVFRRKLLPHVFVCQQLVQERDACEDLEGHYDGKYATACEAAGKWDEAIDSYKGALYRWKMEHTLDTTQCIFIMTRLSKILYEHRNRWSEAGQLLWEIIERRRFVLGESHTATIDGYYALTHFLGEMGHMDTRLRCYEKIIELCQMNGSNAEMERAERVNRGLVTMRAQEDRLQQQFEDFALSLTGAPDEERAAAALGTELQVEMSTMSNSQIEDWVASQKAHFRQNYETSRQVQTHTQASHSELERRKWTEYDDAIDTYGVFSAGAFQKLQVLAEIMFHMERMACAEILAKELVRRSIMHRGPTQIETTIRLSKLIIYALHSDHPEEAYALAQHAWQQSLAVLGSQSHIAQMWEMINHHVSQIRGTYRARDAKFKILGEIARERGLTDAAWFLSNPPAGQLPCCLDFPDRHSRWAYRLRMETLSEMPEGANDEEIHGLWGLGLDIPSSVASPRYWGPTSEQLMC